MSCPKCGYEENHEELEPMDDMEESDEIGSKTEVLDELLALLGNGLADRLPKKKELE